MDNWTDEELEWEAHVERSLTPIECPECGEYMSYCWLPDTVAYWRCQCGHTEDI